MIRIACRKIQRDKNQSNSLASCIPRHVPSYSLPPMQSIFLFLSAPTRKMTTGDNASVTLLSVLIDIISSRIVMQPNLKCFYWRDVVFTLTAVTVFPCYFRVLKLVTLKCGIDHGFRCVKSSMLHAVLLCRLDPREYVLHLLLCYVCRPKF
jgi:hypothetical protein